MIGIISDTFEAAWKWKSHILYTFGSTVNILAYDEYIDTKHIWLGINNHINLCVLTNFDLSIDISKFTASKQTTNPLT